MSITQPPAIVILKISSSCVRKASSFYEEGAIWVIFSLPAHLLLPVRSLRQYLLNTLYVPGNLPKHWGYSSEQTKNFWFSQSLYSNILLKWIMTYFLRVLILFCLFWWPSVVLLNLTPFPCTTSRPLEKRYMEISSKRESGRWCQGLELRYLSLLQVCMFFRVPPWCKFWEDYICGLHPTTCGLHLKIASASDWVSCFA